MSDEVQKAIKRVQQIKRMTDDKLRLQPRTELAVMMEIQRRKLAANKTAFDALREFIEQAESYCHSTGHKEQGAAMFGACDSICQAIPKGKAALRSAEKWIEFEK